MSLQKSLAGIFFAIICMSVSGIWAASALYHQVDAISEAQIDLQVGFGRTSLKAELTEQRVIRMESDISEIKKDVKEVIKIAKQ
jgi:hypothetical protein